MTETETKWSERVKSWKASGETAKAFAQGREFKASTLTYWAYRLRQGGGPSAATPEGLQARSVTTPEIRMVRVRRASVGRTSPAEGAIGSSSPTMVIAIGAARIEVRSGFDRGLLTEVVEALGGAR